VGSNSAGGTTQIGGYLDVREPAGNFKSGKNVPFLSNRNNIGHAVDDVLSQEISEGITRAVRQIAESQKPLKVTGGSPYCVIGLIALRKYVLRTELQGMLANRFAHVITQRIARVRMAPRHIRGIGR